MTLVALTGFLFLAVFIAANVRLNTCKVEEAYFWGHAVAVSGIVWIFSITIEALQ